MSKQPHLLFVDDEQLLHGVFTRLFSRQGMRVTSCLDGHQAIEALKKEDIDLVVTDFKMPEMDGFELLAHIRQQYPRLRVVMITAHANVQHAVRAMKGGVVDYLPKPFSTTELVERVETLLKEPMPEASPSSIAGAAQGTRRSRSKQAAATYVGEHPNIVRLREMLALVSKNRAPVFIQGESGTGKEILARLIHQMSGRAEGPFVALNCANLPRELVESHLFGHRKGAFTGAIDDMVGAFERAHGGTLLLDEITEVEPAVQAKLLRVLQEQEIVKVGETHAKRVDVRVVATSNRDLSEAIRDGAFREDLYHRLAVFPLTVPPLRERRSDVPLLAWHFAEKYSGLYGLPEKRFSEDLMARLMRRAWPGNVRQLENLVHRGVILSAEREVIEESDIFDDFFADAEGEADSVGGKVVQGELVTIEEAERYMIIEALRETDGNQREAAERLGISDRTIRNKLKKYREEGSAS